MSRAAGLFASGGVLAARAAPAPVPEKSLPWRSTTRGRSTTRTRRFGPGSSPANEQALARIDDVRGFGAYRHVLGLYPAEPTFTGRLIFLTDSACVSACLNVADWLLALPAVSHVGQPTSADTSYMEVLGTAASEGHQAVSKARAQ